MRTFKFKRIGMILLIALGLTLVGCDSYVSSYAGPGGLDIQIQEKSLYSTEYTVATENDKFVVTDPKLMWYYDIPDGELEYVIVQYTPIVIGQKDSNIRYIQVHQWINKKPEGFDK